MGRRLLIAATLLANPLLQPLLPAQGDPLAGEARQEFMQRVEQSMGGVQTVAAGFVQEKHLSLFGDVVRTEGVILFARPDKLRWEIRSPFRSILLVAGDQVAKFEFHKGERRRLELGRSSDVIRIVMDQIRSWFRGDFEKSSADYTVQVFGSTPARVVLRPKDPEIGRNLEAIELELEEDLSGVTMVTIRESGGDRTVMRFKRIPGAPELAAEYFDALEPRDLDPDLLRAIVDK
jgi:outer membrane lipoprotein-sorting protein